MTELNIENVDRIFSDCMFRSHEEYEERKKEGLHVFVHSIQNPKVKIGFHPERIEAHRQEIREMLSQLPDGFFPGTGDGASFLQACYTKDGQLWTGIHLEMEKLCLLGVASKEMIILTPDPAIRVSLPGGMPYFRVEKEKQTD